VARGLQIQPAADSGLAVGRTPGGPAAISTWPARALPARLSLIGADSGIVADLYRSGDQIEAVVLDADPGTPATISSGGQQRTLPPAALTIIPVELAAP
jgi:hypothetical protein